MSIRENKPIRFAIAHLFTTGRDALKYSILHFACIRYEEGSVPQMNDWLINPDLKQKDGVRIRVVARTGIKRPDVENKPLWTEIRGQVLSFLEGVDFIFIRNSDVDSQWFENVVYKDMTPPTLIDLTEMYQFFLPENPIPYSESELINLGESIQVYKGNRKLHKVINGMYFIMDRILRVILLCEEINTELHFPVYSLLHWALSAEGNQPSFEAIYKVA